MKRFSIPAIAVLFVFLFASCDQTDPEIARARAQAEAAKQKAKAAKAEADAAKAEIVLFKSKEEIRKKKEQDERDAAREKARRDAERRRTLSRQALAYVERNGSHILNYAYPLALELLTYKNAKLLGVGSSRGGYTATVRLNYLNIFDSPHYLEIAFNYDSQGGYRSWRFVGHSDIIAPKELTVGTLMKFVKE